MKNVTGAIGGTPLVELTRTVPNGQRGARVLVKVESHNPTGSMKDRMALAVVDRAAASGRLPPNGTLVEYTGGSTGNLGRGHCIAGVAEVLRRHNPAVRIVAVEPAESPVLSGGSPGAHQIEGVGPGFVAPLWDAELADDILAVSTADAKDMSRRLARQETLFGGTSSGANMVAALRTAERLDAGWTVVTLICDSGMKYLSTDLYSAG